MRTTRSVPQRSPWSVIVACVSALLVTIFVIPVSAATVTWDGGTGNWNDNTWNTGNPPPTAGDTAIINGGSVTLSNSTPLLATFTMGGGTLVFTNWSTKLSATNVNINVGTVTLPVAYTNNVMSNRVWIACSNLTVASGASIDTDERGFAGGAGTNPTTDGHGPGAGAGSGSGNRSGGGGHGGVGSVGSAVPFYKGWDVLQGQTYDSPAAPIEPGSGAAGQSSGQGGNGGGAVRIEASGHVVVNGTITASAIAVGLHTGGGSGGSIYITCNTIASTNGAIRADGGSASPGGVGSGGGGGRIAIAYNTTAQAALAVPDIFISADRGEGGGNYAELGTVYLPDNRFITAANMPQLSGAFLGFSSAQFDSLTITNGRIRFGQSGFTMTVTNDLTINGSKVQLSLGGNASTQRVTSLPFFEVFSDYSSRVSLNVGGNLLVTNQGALHIYSAGTNSTPNDYGALVSVTGDIHIATNSWIHPHTHPVNGGSPLFTLQNLNILTAGSGFDANYLGYASEQGSGAGTTSLRCGGGAFGGRGGDGSNGTSPGGDPYGSTNAPLNAGSAGGRYTGSGGHRWGSRGGGLIRIDARGTITMNGLLTANGADFYNTAVGAGAGGGIFVIGRTFQGTGTIQANGGAGQIAGAKGSGGGGGGRIAIWVGNFFEDERTDMFAGTVPITVTITDSHDDFTGTLSVTNGNGWSVVNNPPNGPDIGSIVFALRPPGKGTVITVR